MRVAKTKNLKIRTSEKEAQDNFNCPVESLEPLLATPILRWKRAVDISGSILVLLILLPSFFLIFIIIKIVSPGPAFFKQERTGYLGRPFMMWKFRTMKINSDISRHKDQIRTEIQNDLTLSKVKNDSRIFPFGNFLRQSSLDELPQLINVLKGEMSLVGPRPELPYAVNEFKRWHCARFDVLPGMTGLWQISGKNSTTFTQMIRYDLKYRRKLSFWFEIKILLLTIPVVFKQLTEHLKE